MPHCFFRDLPALAAEPSDWGTWHTRGVHEMSLSEAITAEGPRLMSLAGVVGVAEGSESGVPCIVVYVTEGSRPGEIPGAVHGHPVVVRPSGEIRALQQPYG